MPKLRIHTGNKEQGMTDGSGIDEESNSKGRRDSGGLSKIVGGYQPGDLIAERYEVIKLLGKGGMGMVYLVQDTKRERRIALKTLLPQYATNQRAVGRFVREVNAVRQLDHPGIVKILAARQHESLLFYTMEYLEGKTVREYMKKRGRLGLGSTVRILSLLCNALEHVHAVTVHRDISPENIMLLADGTIKLLDFGLAKLQDPTGAQFTQVGTTLGRIQYNAPEQAFNAADVDQRADLYSIGVICYEMLTAKVPRAYEPITDIRPDLPKEVNTFLKKALARDPAERFATAAEFRDALNRVYKIHTGEIQPDAGSDESLGFFARILALFRRKATVKPQHVSDDDF
ncbi:MAG: serine/threonine protein kinase [Candidatus Hydrogenedentes bacterium]|nr:serine/threonine protein kinase [Candidatus Hydrogenedentota bacterium]